MTEEGDKLDTREKFRVTEKKYKLIDIREVLIILKYKL